MSAKSVRRRVGDLGENIACEFLQKKGFRVLDRNFSKPWGEIDIIAEKGRIVHFVEVKSVSRERNYPEISREIEYRPEEMATSSKLKKVARTASLYMDSKGDDREYQIDVLGVVMFRKERLARCRLFEQVLEGDL